MSGDSGWSLENKNLVEILRVKKEMKCFFLASMGPVKVSNYARTTKLFNLTRNFLYFRCLDIDLDKIWTLEKLALLLYNTYTSVIFSILVLFLGPSQGLFPVMESGRCGNVFLFPHKAGNQKCYSTG